MFKNKFQLLQEFRRKLHCSFNLRLNIRWPEVILFENPNITCASSIVLRFSRWMSHGRDRLRGRKGRSFGSWLSPGPTMVRGGWQRESEVRWASSDRCSTEVLPASCQKKTRALQRKHLVWPFIRSHSLRDGHTPLPAPQPSCSPAAGYRDSPSACCRWHPDRDRGYRPAAAAGPIPPPAHLPRWKHWLSFYSLPELSIFSCDRQQSWTPGANRRTLTRFEWRDGLTLSRQQSHTRRRVLQEWCWGHWIKVGLQGELRKSPPLLHLQAKSVTQSHETTMNR